MFSFVAGAVAAYSAIQIFKCFNFDMDEYEDGFMDCMEEYESWYADQIEKTDPKKMMRDFKRFKKQCEKNWVVG